MSTNTAEQPEPQWLSEEEQRIWRSWVAVPPRLMAVLGRGLLQDSGLSLADYEVLVNVSEAEGRRVRIVALAEQMQWDRSRLSHQISRMEKRGLVRREQCTADARGMFVVLTDDGWRAIDDAAPAHVTDVRRVFFDALSTEDQAALSRCLTALQEAVLRAED